MATMFDRLADLNASNHQAHPLHHAQRIWPETNCYVDLWIEVLNAIGLEPRAMLGFTLTQDFEGDQFTFFKTPLEDLERLYDIRVTELAIYDSVERHVATQIARGRLCLVEVDGYFLPDTHGVSYRIEHGKTTIAPTSLDAVAKTLTYFHNGGLFELTGADFDGVFQRGDHAQPMPFLPYTEFVKFPGIAPDPEQVRQASRALLTRHFARRPAHNPITSFSDVFTTQAEHLADQPFETFHRYAFNTLRQVGANFELLGDHLDWLAPNGCYAGEARAARTIAETAKAVQFQLARALARKKFASLDGSLAAAESAWDQVMNGLAKKLEAPGSSSRHAERAA